MGLHDFVGARQPWMLPNAIVAAGMGWLHDFVPVSNWVLPNEIIASANGSLPKAPDIPRALIGAKNGKAAGCGGPCGCSGGMGALTGDTLIPQASLPSFLQGDALISGVPTVYLAGGVLLVAVMMMGGKSSYSRRRNPTRRRNPRRRQR